jgi:hypothetical protein
MGYGSTINAGNPFNIRDVIIDLLELSKPFGRSVEVDDVFLHYWLLGGELLGRVVLARSGGDVKVIWCVG